MSKKYYFIQRGRFGNEYVLGWGYDDQADGWERITRAEALKLAQEEAWRRKHDKAFSGYATEFVWPIVEAGAPALAEDQHARLSDGLYVDGWQVVSRIVCPKEEA